MFGLMYFVGQANKFLMIPITTRKASIFNRQNRSEMNEIGRFCVITEHRPTDYVGLLKPSRE